MTGPRALEIIGEAEGRISKKTRKGHPEIPWTEITGMRNRLAHGYFEVNLGKVWDTVHRDPPPLTTMIELLIPPEEP